MTRDISLYVKDIFENMSNAQKFIGKMTYEEFAIDKKTAYAVIRCLEIIGEASKNMPESFRAAHPDIPWKKMAGMRDKVIHFYFGVNFEKVWLVVKNDIPKLKPLIKKVLESLEK